MEGCRKAIAIQCRSKSTRFPFKCFAQLNGKTVIRKIYDDIVDEFETEAEVVVLIPIDDEDLALYLLYQNIPFFMAGKTEDDVVDRFQTYLIANPDVDCIARVTADDPFRNLQDLRELFDLMEDHYYLEYAYSKGLPYGANNEVFSRRWLLNNDKQVDREHISNNLYLDWSHAYIEYYESPISKFNLSLDEPEQLPFLNYIAEQVAKQNKSVEYILYQCLEGGKSLWQAR